MDVPDQLPRARPQLRGGLGTLSGRRGRGLVVEAVKIATGLFEFLDPFLGLAHSTRERRLVPRGRLRLSGQRVARYLGNHHVAVERPLAVALRRFVDVRTDLRNHRRTKGKVRDEVPVPEVLLSAGMHVIRRSVSPPSRTYVHDIDMEPVSTLLDGL